MQEGCGQAVFSFKCKAVFLFGQNLLPVISRTHSGGVAVAYSKMAPLYYARKAWSAKMRMQIKLRTNFQVCFLILLGRLYPIGELGDSN